MKRIQLFLLHFAGGSRYSFQFLQPHLHEVIFTPVELPGRGKRSEQALLKDFEEAALDICEQIQRNIVTDRFVIYGHSLGALLALRVTSMLEECNRAPLHVIVSGNAGPGSRADRKRYLLDRQAFKEELRILGGIVPEFLENEELFSFYEPILRADFELAENNPPSLFPVINTPVYAMMGDQEESKHLIDNWKNFTTAETVSEILSGDHFFINNHAGRIAEIIKNCSTISA